MAVSLSWTRPPSMGIVPNRFWREKLANESSQASQKSNETITCFVGGGFFVWGVKHGNIFDRLLLPLSNLCRKGMFFLGLAKALSAML